VSEPSHIPIDENVLIQECKAGALNSFEPIVKKHQARLLKIAYQLLRDERLAEEAVQITFVKAWQKLNKFNGECDFGTWLFRLCVNTSYDQIRSRNRKKEDPISYDEDEDHSHTYEMIRSTDPSPAQETLREETRKMISDALDKLPEDQRVVIVLREMHGLDYREIAQTLGCREGTVMSRLFHARRKMRQLLKNHLQLNVIK
jgi:RNA polymerase sigma-70 factor, ECF subfamily